MKIKTSEAIAYARNLERLSGKVLPVKLGYAISKNLKTFRKEVQDYEEERLKRCRQLAEKDENGEPVIVADSFQFSDEHRKLINEEVNELLNTEAEIDIYTVDVSQLEAMEDSDRYDMLTVDEIGQLDFMIS